MDSRKAFNVVSLSDLVALNDEMAALVRSGTSLEQGLVELGNEYPGRLGNLATHLGQRLQSGESLTAILRESSSTFPPVWVAMVAAGIRSGRLAVVLESLATTGRRIAEMRRTVGAALLYPMIVVILAYLVFVFLVSYLAPILSDAYLDLTASQEPFVAWLAWLGANAAWWAFWPPAALATLLAVEWFQSRRGFQSSIGPLSNLIAYFWPPIKRSRQDAKFAGFTEILSILIREGTPLPEALELAANASSDSRLQVSATQLAERISRGQSLSVDDARALRIPPLLGFMLSTGANRADLSDALAASAARYRERSTDSAARTALVLPIALTACVGGAVTLAIGLIAVWPVWQLLLKLGN